ncbi:MAG: ferrous iron transport protein A [Candidatus Atribacteria bacterium]|jgi:ferrous iron transport protein A|nr:ferrous iron transport protein A [Candidatus Atribacteria bacterium]
MIYLVLKRCITTKSTDSNATLIDMLPGQTGIITEIDQGHGLARKLWAMGIIPGKKVVKVSQIIGGGPIVIRIDAQELALGRGVANRIKVKIEK